jgi:hypothetical protein
MRRARVGRQRAPARVVAMSLAMLLALLAGAGSGAGALEPAEVVRLGLPTEDDVAAWARPGLRLQLGYDYSVLSGAGPAWSWRSHGVLLRPSLRLDRWWEIGLGLRYGTAPGGLRWSVTAEPTVRPWRRLAVSGGLGYGGLNVRTARRPEEPLPTGVLVSRTLADDEALPACNGSAFSSLARVEYLFVVGPLFSSGPFTQAELQWTRCQHQVAAEDGETGRAVKLTQWWRHAGVSVGWWLAWR